MKKIVASVLYSFCLIASLNGQNSSPVLREWISHPDQVEHQIEYYFAKPEGEGPFPVIFLLPGYQPPENSVGGKQLIEYEYQHCFINDGIAVVAISPPGYGSSTGVRDFGGPNSQRAVVAVINHFKELPWVDASKLGIYGISRGASLAYMSSVHCPDLSFQILEGGFYDYIDFCSSSPEYLEGIRRNLIEEAGSGEESLIERSPVFHTEDMQASTLILHGEFDDRKQLPAARVLCEKLNARNIPCTLKVYSNTPHSLFFVHKWDTILPFVRRHFFDHYGIGIKVSMPFPAIQVIKVNEGTPAALSGRLQVGDAILRISPDNNENELDVLRMPLQDFIHHVHGKKGTSIRLQVQHFDGLLEEIVLQRG